MFEDPDLPDSLSLSLNESYDEQNSPSHDSKKASESPDYNCETPEIQVIIKEEEEGWTVSGTQNFGPDDAPGRSSHLEACRISYGLKGGGSAEKCSEECGRSSSSTDMELKVSCKRGKAAASVEVRQCINGGERASAGEASRIRQNTTSEDAKMSAPCQETRLEDQTLHLTVRLRAGEEEEEQDEEISGLINSDGEVVEWDGGSSPDCRPQPSKRDSSSPTLVMEVESVGDEEERDGAVQLSSCGRRHRRRKKVPEITVDVSDTEREAHPAKRRRRRRISKPPVVSAEDLEAEPGISSRTRRNRNVVVESEEFNSNTVRRVAAKRPYRRRTAAEGEAGPGSRLQSAPKSSAKKRPGRKTLRVPIDIPPELLKKPKEKMEYHCSVCGKEFPHAYKLERHGLIHTGEKPYCCSICGRGFNQKGNLKTHFKVHLGRKGAVGLEEEESPMASELSEYLKTLPGESRIRSALRCLQCGKECENHAALQAHHITTHAERAGEPGTVERGASAQPLICRRCGVQFGEREKLEEHMKSHVKAKPYSCPDCGKRFINESYIQIHQRIHTGEKPFLCAQCGRGFHTASSLKLHEMQHTGERPFACLICGKTFRINSYLTAHYQTHIKERPFVCSVCGKGYSRAEELKVHHRLHTGERPYQCAECGKSFIYRQGLRQHQRTHAGKRIGPTRQLGRPKQARLDA